MCNVMLTTFCLCIVTASFLSQVLCACLHRLQLTAEGGSLESCEHRSSEEECLLTTEPRGTLHNP